MRLLLFNLATDADDPILGFTTRWIRALAERVDFIHVITMRSGRLDLPANVRVYSVGKEKCFSEARRAVEFYRHLFRIVRERERFDACFSHMIPIFSVLAAPVLRLNGTPIVTWYCHPGLSWTLKLAHHLSRRMISGLSTSYPYRLDKLIVVGHGIDTELFTPADMGLAQEDPPVILCVGRLSPAKDHPTLLKAVWMFRQSSSQPFRVVIVGGPARPSDDAYMRLVQKQVKDLGLGDTVSFERAVAMERLPYWYRRCAVHVNLAPIGSGDKVALEAMACGAPTVVANVDSGKRWDSMPKNSFLNLATRNNWPRDCSGYSRCHRVSERRLENTETTGGLDARSQSARAEACRHFRGTEAAKGSA